ncbi:hypothetical protein H6G45_17565 [Synechocystis sp. FACHB-383]|uniref:hypothetical protein n=1 Tax=Synechocystis sp. FACHB-383 TaxID=2692864 RepID=UPI001683DC71|nr:hypothetical protein [Synechocystis sp. FACHB-383]MBD2655258.1 hypothetical protein [Synechocystis sp. FACHB-383]
MGKQSTLNQLIQQDANIIPSEAITSFNSYKDDNHLQRRQQQRAINTAMIQVALTYGQQDYSHGAVRFTLTDRLLRQSPYAKMTDALRGLRVICQPTITNTQIVTAYWHHQTKQRAR